MREDIAIQVSWSQTGATYHFNIPKSASSTPDAYSFMDIEDVKNFVSKKKFSALYQQYHASLSRKVNEQDLQLKLNELFYFVCSKLKDVNFESVDAAVTQDSSIFFKVHKKDKKLYLEAFAGDDDSPEELALTGLIKNQEVLSYFGDPNLVMEDAISFLAEEESSMLKSYEKNSIETV